MFIKFNSRSPIRKNIRINVNHIIEYYEDDAVFNGIVTKIIRVVVNKQTNIQTYLIDDMDIQQFEKLIYYTN